ncbi:hypothetical protein L596_019703 [Steinernema carpocapsae]|uniref:Uncharacterized protein n=1 Tax=Steinernema carpocapsae TaxID=34508 RepID=A0A4U5MRB8_STECR|nr:hypothetical protein L596_019703 [Steinernema carpocapsae]
MASSKSNPPIAAPEAPKERLQEIPLQDIKVKKPFSIPKDHPNPQTRQIFAKERAYMNIMQKLETAQYEHFVANFEKDDEAKKNAPEAPKEPEEDSEEARNKRISRLKVKDQDYLRIVHRMATVQYEDYMKKFRS